MTPKLAAALAKVQAELPKLERDRTVTVEPKDKTKPPYTYSYVTLANLSEAILPLLAKHGLSFAAMPGASADGKMSVHYHLMHESGETLTGEFPISGEGGIQMIGGRITYARRYCLAAIVGVAADEDDESHLEDGGRGTAQRAPRRAPEPAPTEGRTAQRAKPAGRPALPSEVRISPGPITSSQQKMMHALLNESDRGDRDVGLVYIAGVIGREIDSTKELTVVEAGKVIDTLSRQGAGDGETD